MSLHVRMRSPDECVIVCEPQWLAAMYTAIGHVAREIQYEHPQWRPMHEHLLEVMHANGIDSRYDVVPGYDRLTTDVQGDLVSEESPLVNYDDPYPYLDVDDPPYYLDEDPGY